MEWLIWQSAFSETYLRWFRFKLTLICSSILSFICTSLYLNAQSQRERELRRKKDAFRQTLVQSTMADSPSKICLKWHWMAFKMTGYSDTLRGHKQGNGVMMDRDGYWWHNEQRMAEEWCLISYFYMIRCRRLATILCNRKDVCRTVFFFFYILIPPAPMHS